jgi:hypothetical protein
MSASPEQAWIENWRAAGAELEERRRSDLRALTPERARFLSEAALSLAQAQELPEHRRRHSGLVELQELFRLLRSR